MTEIHYTTPLEVKFASEVKYTQLEFDQEADYDAYIQNQLIPMTMKVIDNYVGHNFQNNSATTLTLDGNGKITLLIHPPYVPILTVTALTVDGVNILSTAKVYNAFIKLSSGAFYETAPQNVSVTLTYGYTSVPADIKDVCAQICANRLNDRIKRKMMPDWVSMALARDAGSGSIRLPSSTSKLLTPDLKQVLDRYKFSYFDVT